MSTPGKNTSRKNFASIPDRLIIQSFARLDRTAMGVAVGVVFGMTVFGATVILLIKGGTTIGPNLRLLGQYFPGYTVSWSGSVVGLAYGFASGFIFGWSAAFLRNLLLNIYIRIIKLKANLSSAQDLFE